MKTANKLVGNGGEAAPSIDGRRLQQVLKTLHIAQRVLASGTAQLAAPHVQLAIELLTWRPTGYLMQLFDGDKVESRTRLHPQLSQGYLTSDARSPNCGVASASMHPAVLESSPTVAATLDSGLSAKVKST